MASATSFAAGRLTWVLEARVLAPTPNSVKKEAREDEDQLKIVQKSVYYDGVALWRHAESGVNTTNSHRLSESFNLLLPQRLTLVVGGCFQRAGDICSVKVQGFRVMTDGA